MRYDGLGESQTAQTGTWPILLGALPEKRKPASRRSYAPERNRAAILRNMKKAGYEPAKFNFF
jgi:hypothetical protein